MALNYELTTTDLSPAVARNVLLYQLTYLYLAGYSDLEQMVLVRALKTRSLYVSSEIVMLKCVRASNTLLTSHLPNLKRAVEKNKPDLAKTYLKRTKGWIAEIIKAAGDMVDEYKRESDALSDTTTTIFLKTQKNLRGSIPSPERLEEVRNGLVRIQEVLMLIVKFWSHVGVMLNRLEQHTFAGTDLLDELQDRDFKKTVLDSLTAAEKAWKLFGQSCMKSQEVFRVQSKEGYKFLEIKPSTLPEAERRRQIGDVKRKLEKIR